MEVVSLLFAIVTLAAQWMYYQKMGREGWEGIIPLYNEYVLFEVLYGNGWRFLLMLVPFYNIYLAFKVPIDLAHGFNKSTGFGIGLALLSPIFSCILGFGDAQYGDGSQAVSGDDPVSSTINRAVNGRGGDVSDKLRALNRLHEDGIITDEEYEQKKSDLLKKL